MSESYQLSLFQLNKRCYDCGAEKPLSEFYRHPDMSDGYLNQCKPCHNAYGKRSYQEAAEQRRAYSREYYVVNREKQQAANRRWNEAHPEQRRTHRAKWREANPVKIKQLSAARLNAPGSHTAEDLEQMYESQEGRCAYCERELDEHFHVDHMTPVCRGGRNDWTNLAITCPTCNLRKNRKTVVEFMEYLKSDVWI